jgi:hypothetical protein
MHDPKKHNLINAFVGFGEGDLLDAMLANHPIPANPDVLSIDIDGNDYYAWAAINRIRAKIVVIEFNPTIANAVYFVQKCDPKVMQGASPAPLVELGRKKGYELIAATGWNLIFADAQYYDLFHITDNSLEVMREEKNVRHMFIGTDGRVLLEYGGEFGSVPLHWHYPVRLYESSLQPLPKILQCYKQDYDPLRLFLFRLHWQPSSHASRLLAYGGSPTAGGFVLTVLAFRLQPRGSIHFGHVTMAVDSFWCGQKIGPPFYDKSLSDRDYGTCS